MEQEIENQGYVVAGKMKGLAKLYLISWTVRSGQMSYENMVKVAKDNDLSKDQIPELRPAKNAFAVSKDVLKGMKLDTLLELEGWDGQVKQTLDVKPLKRGLEYQISIVREGMMNGKLHKDSIPVVRLKFSPPEDFNYRAWVKNYMRSFWDEKYIARIKEGTEEAPQLSQITQCITQLPYWDDTRVNPMLMMNIRNRIVQAFQNPPFFFFICKLRIFSQNFQRIQYFIDRSMHFKRSIIGYISCDQHLSWIFISQFIGWLITSKFICIRLPETAFIVL